MFTPVEKQGGVAVSDFVISAASGVHEVARKGVRAIGYDGKGLSSAVFQPDRAPHPRSAVQGGSGWVMPQ